MSFWDVTTVFVLSYVLIAGVAFLTRVRRQTYFGQTIEHDRSGDVPEPMSRGKRVFLIAFLTVWLFGWTFGVLLVLAEWRSTTSQSDDFIFMSIWLCVGIPGWFFVAWTLFRLYRGDDVDVNMDGDAH